MTICAFAQRRTVFQVYVLLAVALFPVRTVLALATAMPLTRPGAALAADITGTVVDSTSAQPLPAADIILLRASTAAIVTNTTTDRFGHFTLHNVASGNYIIVARLVGFALKRQPLTVTGTGAMSVSLALVPAAPVELASVQVQAQPPAVDTRTGDQVLNQQTADQVIPTATTSALVQESIAGAARAPTGEVHINGQHAEYTYYIDGVPVPSGISGSLNEIFSPDVVDEIGFQTGGWDAEFGNKNAAVINVTTKIPSGGFHLNAGEYVGQFDPSSTTGPNRVNGRNLSLSTNSGAWGVFVSGAHQYSDMRLEPIKDDDDDPNKVNNFHNSGTDDFGFGKIQYTAGKNNVFDLDVNLSQTKFAVPYDSTGNVLLDDHQHDFNGFVNLAWHLQTGDSAAKGAAFSEVFAGLFARFGSLTYTPGAEDTPSFIFFPDTNPFNLTEQRNFDTYGLKLDYSIHPGHDLLFKFGTISSVTSGHEDFSTIDAQGRAGPASNSGLSGSDVGVYAETQWAPVEEWEIRTGTRYDAHTAPFAGTQNQLSPRFRLSYFPSTSTTMFVYYGRMFIPTNIEDLRSITSVSQHDTATAPTLPERDNWFEGGLIQRFPEQSMIVTLDGFYKHSTPGIDDNTVPGSSIVTDVNISQVWIKGIKSVIEYQPSGPLSAGINVALTHAYGIGPITGGFFPTATPSGYFDLDHDQRLSIAAHGTYTPTNRFVATVTDIYGSGLTNNEDSTSCGCKYSTSLFAFDPGVKVPPSNIIDVSGGYKLTVGGTVVTPQLNVDNLFDHMYLLKGAFFSGASVGRPREISLRVDIAY